MILRECTSSKDQKVMRVLIRPMPWKMNNRILKSGSYCKDASIGDMWSRLCVPVSYRTSYFNALPFCQGLKGESDCYPQMRGNWTEASRLKSAMKWKLLKHQHHCHKKTSFVFTWTDKGAKEDFATKSTPSSENCGRTFCTSFMVWQKSMQTSTCLYLFNFWLCRFVSV